MVFEAGIKRRTIRFEYDIIDLIEAHQALNLKIRLENIRSEAQQQKFEDK